MTDMTGFDPYKMIGGDWALFGVSADGESNAMTVSWGEAGVLWNKPIFTVFIRPTRYTYTLAEKTDIATLSFFPEEYKKTLSYFGRVSGRDENKLCKLSHKTENGILTFDAASLTLVGRKLYYTDIDPDKFIDPAIDSNYDNDYHRVYVYEIIEKTVR